MDLNSRKVEIILLIILVLFAVGARLVTLPKGEFFGADNFYHHSILMQSRENNHLSIENKLEMCYQGAKGGHPIGFYLFPFLLSYLIGTFYALALSSVIYAAISILLAYFLFKLIFNKQVAFIAAFLIAGTNAHLARSVALIYKGDNLILIFILLGLYLAVKALQSDIMKHKIYLAIATGIITGLSTIFWNGYMLVLAIVNTAMIFYILYEYIKEKEVRPNLIAASITLLIQLILVEILGHMFITILIEFYKKTYPLYFILPALILFGVLEIFHRLSHKNKNLRYAPFVIFIAFGIIIFIIKFSTITSIIGGFGFISADNPFAQNIQEQQPLDLSYLWFHMWFFIITAIAGIYFLAKKPNAKKITMILLLIIFCYMAISSKRYLFFASVPLQLCSALFIYAIINSFKKIKTYLYIIPIILIVANAAYAINSVNTYLNPRTDNDLIQAYTYLNQNTEPRSCVISTWDKGGMTQHYAKRYSYASSVGGQSIGRIKNINNLLLNNNLDPFTQENLYILTQETDLLQIKSMTALIETTNIGGAILTQKAVQDRGLFQEITLTSNVDGSQYVIKQYRDENKVEFFMLQNKQEIPIQTLIVKQKNQPTAILNNDNYRQPGCLFIGNKISAFFSEALCNTYFVKMISGQEIEKLKLFYFNNGVSIYKLSE